ncbi:tetratricopeptide repeat protein [Phycisphaera mikurensis]|uniref:Tetratricopeptide repeat protein n=1 Tax=Phycisphaera mikurensis (strain NBRC 102666 / KCTC 22515 / FYK2301M01) TaxID=1142394 RepID=I0IF87_PHYMF|nr:hypothetical protein [Phycisphaera mikurensis]MBB6440679.1 hypothetical protein [Phycisphaera mikurensis]BAM03925.1 hypothetical protein PSMK_17660 [Phycisphaera mikurensis NBRC 102666]
MPRSRIALASIALLGAATAGAGEPRRPASDDEVLERIPRVLFAAGDRLAGLRARLAEDPRDTDAAVRLAADSLEIARREDDPRFFGHARAALSPWWGLEDPPLAVLRLRAKLRERDHDYRGALADQRSVLDRAADDPQALLEVANLHYVLGDYPAARAAVARLEAAGEDAAATAARLPLDVVTGHAERALADADALLADPGTPPALRGFADVVAADAARALGRFDAAEARFRAGLARDPGDAYLLRAYADFLLDRGRPAAVLPLAAARLSDTGLLLAHALAATRAGEGGAAAASTRRLADRFAEIRLRGSDPHGRYESRFELELQGDARRALEVALQNWDLQKQPRDSRNVLEAALAAGRPAAAGGVVAFLRDAGTEDADLAPLLDALAPGGRP